MNQPPTKFALLRSNRTKAERLAEALAEVHRKQDEVNHMAASRGMRLPHPERLPTRWKETPWRN